MLGGYTAAGPYGDRTIDHRVFGKTVNVSAYSLKKELESQLAAYLDLPNVDRRIQVERLILRSFATVSLD